jgi:hypothetical protein
VECFLALLVLLRSMIWHLFLGFEGMASLIDVEEPQYHGFGSGGRVIAKGD